MVQKALSYKAMMFRLKSMFFCHNLSNNLFNNLVLMSYVNDIYLMVSLVREMGAENIEKKEENRENKNKKKEKEKKMKNTGKVKSQK